MPSQTHTIYLGLGVNLGERRAALRTARDRLMPTVEVTRCSGLYETPPWGVLDQPPFLNAVCEAHTALTPEELLAYLKRMEHELGRVATSRWGPRAIDLDILFYDDLVFNSPQLTIPHPLLHERAFVLVPLRELAPHLHHPVLNTSVSALAQHIPSDNMQMIATTW